MSYSDLLQFKIQLTIISSIELENRTFDYIVIGSGSGGSVMGARLTQDPSLTTLIIEAGCKDPKLTSEVKTPSLNENSKCTGGNMKISREKKHPLETIRSIFF